MRKWRKIDVTNCTNEQIVDLLDCIKDFDIRAYFIRDTPIQIKEGKSYSKMLKKYPFLPSVTISCYCKTTRSECEMLSKIILKSRTYYGGYY